MIVSEKIKQEELEKPFIKAVVDLKRKKISIGCELHVDCQEELIHDGSLAADTWGFNVYPDGKIDFVSLINIRPKAGNRSIEIKDGGLCAKILEVVKQFLPAAYAPLEN